MVGPEGFEPSSVGPEPTMLGLYTTGLYVMSHVSSGAGGGIRTLVGLRH